MMAVYRINMSKPVYQPSSRIQFTHDIKQSKVDLSILEPNMLQCYQCCITFLFGSIGFARKLSIVIRVRPEGREARRHVATERKACSPPRCPTRGFEHDERYLTPIINTSSGFLNTHNILPN